MIALVGYFMLFWYYRIPQLVAEYRYGRKSHQNMACRKALTDKAKWMWSQGRFRDSHKSLGLFGAAILKAFVVVELWYAPIMVAIFYRRKRSR